MSSEMQQQEDELPTIVILVVDQDTKVSQRVTLCPSTDLVSYVDLLAALEQQLGPLLESKRTGNNDETETNNSDDVDRISLPPESTNLLVFDKSIGTYVPLSDPPSTCIRDRSKLLIDFVPPSPAAAAAAARRRQEQQHQDEKHQQREKEETSNKALFTARDEVDQEQNSSRNQQHQQQQVRRSSSELVSSIMTKRPFVDPNSSSTNTAKMDTTTSEEYYHEQQQDALRASAPTPLPPSSRRKSSDDHQHANYQQQLQQPIPFQPAGSAKADDLIPNALAGNRSNTNNAFDMLSSSSCANSQPLSPIASLQPEMLLIEVSAKLLGELAGDAIAVDDNSESHHPSSAAASFVSSTIERRLAKLPIVLQEKAVGAWSRAIAEGYELRKNRKLQQQYGTGGGISRRKSAKETELETTLHTVLADRDALLMSLRVAKDEVEELRRQVRLQEQALELTSRPTTATKQQEEQEEQQRNSPSSPQGTPTTELIVSVDEDDVEQQEKLMSSNAGEEYSPTRVENVRLSQQQEDGNDDDSRSVLTQRPESVTPDVAARKSAAFKNVQEENREYGETDPRQFLKNEIRDQNEEEDDDEDDDIDAKFQSNSNKNAPPTRNFTDRYKKKASPPSVQSVQNQNHHEHVVGLNVDVSPSNASEKSDSLTPLPHVRTIASPSSTTATEKNTSEEVATLNNNNNESTHVTQSTAQPQNNSYSSRQTQSKNVFDGTTKSALFAHQQQRLPSSRPLSATLRKIMQDTSDEEIKRSQQQAGSQSVFVSHLPPEDTERDTDYFGRPRTRRVGIVYSDPALSHLPGGQRGTKSFLVPDPPSVQEVVDAAAKALMISSVHIAVGYWAQDGTTPVFIREDSVLQKYMHDQPRVVPFVQCFVVGLKSNQNDNDQDRGYTHQQISSNLGGTSNTSYRPTRPMSAPTAARTTTSAAAAQQYHHYTTNHLPHNNHIRMNNSTSNNNNTGSSYYNHLESNNTNNNNDSTTSFSVSQQQQATSSFRRRQMFTDTNFVSTLDNSKRSAEQSTILKNEHAERGLDVLPPKPSEESKSSPWRLRLDSTPPPVHSAVNSRRFTSNNNSTTTNNMNSSSTTTQNIMDTSTNWEPLYRKQHQTNTTMMSTASASISRPVSAQSRGGGNASNVSCTSTGNNTNSNVATIVWGGLGAPKSVTLMGGGVNEEEFDQLFDELCDEAGTDPETEGVPPNVLLRYLDRNFDNMGDQRRFERLIGSYFCRSKLTRNELTLIMLKMAKE